MSVEQAINVLDRALFYVVNNFGGAPSLFNHWLQLESGNRERAKERLLLTINHSSNVTVISPWDYRVPLYEGDSMTGYDIDTTAVPNWPYGVYTWEGDLLYRVVTDNATFGDSPLDKILVLQARTGDMYYLMYRSYSGDKIKLLLANNLSLESLEILKNKALVPPKEPAWDKEVPEDYSITFNVPPSKVGTIYYLDVYLLPSAPVGVPLIDELKSSSTVRRERIIIDGLPMVRYQPPLSGWLYVEVDGIATTLSRPIGAGVDRMEQASEYLWYIAVGREMDTLLSLPGNRRRPPDFSTNRMLKVEVMLYG